MAGCGFWKYLLRLFYFLYRCRIAALTRRYVEAGQLDGGKILYLHLLPVCFYGDALLLGIGDSGQQ